MNQQAISKAPVDVEAQLVRLLYHNSPTGVLVNGAVALLLVWVLWERVPQTTLMAWVISIFIVNALRFYNYWYFRKASPDDQSISVWRYCFMLGTLLSAAVWGASPWWFGPFHDVVTPMILAFTLGGLMAGAAAILGGVLRVYISYAIIIMGPMTLWFFSQLTAAEISLGVMLLIAMFALTANGLIYRRVLRDSIELSNAWYLAKEEAEEANRAKAYFLSRMSHELRTPLSAILGYAQLVQEQHVRGTQCRIYADQIVDASDHLLALINDLLDLSRIETHKVELQVKQVDCQQLVTQCLQQVLPIAADNKIHLSQLSRHLGVAVLGDEQRVRQILLNLLTNACGYSAVGARIEIGWELTEDDAVRLYVDDLSQSIPEVLQDQMFLSYHRLGRTESAVEGTGLGLMISQQLIELMGGVIGVEREAGRVPRFYVQLPRASRGKRANTSEVNHINRGEPLTGT